MSELNLPLLDPATGEVFEGCPRCAEVKVDDLADAEKELRKARRKITRLEHDEEKARKGDPQRREILDLIQRWKQKAGHPKANANSADRFDVIKARLKEGYSPKELALSIDGIGAYPYVVNGQRVAEGKPANRHDRLGIALGSGESVERFANLGAQARKERDER